MTLNPTLDGFKPCLNIYTSFSITAAAYSGFTAKFGLEKSQWTIFLPPSQQRGAVTPATATPGQVTSRLAGATVLPRRSSLPRMELTGS